MISLKLRQAEYELERNSICGQILADTRRELYLHLPYMDMALSVLYPEQTGATQTLGSDGFQL